MNGIGIKACNAFSDIFQVETVDSKRKLLYKQTFKNRLESIEEPEITKSPSAGYTIMRFKPSYEALGYTDFTKYVDIIDRLLEMRAYEVSAFIGDKC